MEPGLKGLKNLRLRKDGRTKQVSFFGSHRGERIHKFVRFMSILTLNKFCLFENNKIISLNLVLC